MFVLKYKDKDQNIWYFEKIVDSYECNFIEDVKEAKQFDTEMIATRYALLIQQSFGIDCEVIKIEQ